MRLSPARTAGGSSSAPAIPSCIRYPAVPVCKMCRAKISPLKLVSDFYAKPGKWSGSSPKRQLKSHLFRPSIKCASTTTIHGRDLDISKHIREQHRSQLLPDVFFVVLFNVSQSRICCLQYAGTIPRFRLVAMDRKAFVHLRAVVVKDVLCSVQRHIRIRYKPLLITIGNTS